MILVAFNKIYKEKHKLHRSLIQSRRYFWFIIERFSNAWIAELSNMFFFKEIQGARDQASISIYPPFMHAGWPHAAANLILLFFLLMLDTNGWCVDIAYYQHKAPSAGL